jgi:uncharacterized repeat protein (TIGR03803 family)
MGRGSPRNAAQFAVSKLARPLPEHGVIVPMPQIRTFASRGRHWRGQLLALVAPCLFGGLAIAQTAPAVSTAVAFSISNPTGNVVRGTDGAIYGVTVPVTTVSSGLIYRATIDGANTSTVHQIQPEEANSAQSGLIQASDGKLYGTTRFGRSGEFTSAGTIYRVGIDGSGFQVIHRFANLTASNQDLVGINTNGASPEAELVEGNDGYLYGVTREGGANGTGVIYKLARDGTDFQVLRTLSAITSAAGTFITINADGAYPVGALVQGADGLFYGTASSGGTDGRGTVFRIGFDGTGYQVLHNFAATTADTTTGLFVNDGGAAPLAGLTDGQDGFFYGVTSTGGASGAGVVFAIAPDGGTFTVLHTFDVSNGSRPTAELTLGADGKLYGTTAAGGQTAAGGASTLGTIFSLERAGTGFARLYNFDTTHGSVPVSKLVEVSSGVLFGTANSTGRCGYGTLYRYSAAGDTVAGNARCGTGNNNRNQGGGAMGPALLVLLGGMGWMRRRRRPA